MMKKRLFPLLLAAVYLLAGCHATQKAAVPAPAPTLPSQDIIPLPDVVEVVEIIDLAVRDSIPCDQALQPFYEDEEYIYNYSCIKSEYVLVKYSDGTEETVENALKAGKITVGDLDKYGIAYHTTPRSPEITPAEIEYLLAAPVLPEMAEFPLDQSDWDAWEANLQLWKDSRNALHTAPQGYADNLTAFWQESCRVYLSDTGSANAVYSPISLYMALAMLAQTTGGGSRQEILTLLNADSIESLAQQAQDIFLNHYENDGIHTSMLATSLWLDDGRSFNPDTVTLLAEKLYASVYQGALESPEMNLALKDWLNTQTGGLLEDSIMALAPMDVYTVFAIASTIHYRCNWTDKFSPKATSEDVFYSPSGEQAVTYLNKTDTAEYYQASGWSATYLSLEDGSRMWLILPDEGRSPNDILASGEAIDMLLGGDTQKKTLTVKLSVPKFDVSADLDLLDGLAKLGVRQVQDWALADFSSISTDPGIYLGSAQQGVRVSIDEEGLAGAAYTVMMMPGRGMPMGDSVDFVLNRPFLFVVESGDGLPLFAGIVNEP